MVVRNIYTRRQYNMSRAKFEGMPKKTREVFEIIDPNDFEKEIVAIKKGDENPKKNANQ